MAITATFLVLWMVCAFGAITFASLASSSSGRLGVFVTSALAVAAAVWFWGPMDAPLAGVAAASAAAVQLFRPRWTWPPLVAGGSLAGLWPWLLDLGPAVTAASAAFAVAGVGASVWLSRRRGSFAPAMLQEDALLLLLAGGLSLAVLPGILDGWQSAVTLNAAAAPVGGAELPTWLVAAVVGTLALGGVHSVWSRR